MDRTPLLVLVSSCLLLVGRAPAETLETPGYRITLTPECSEGEVSCQHVLYRGVSKKTGSAIELRGGMLHQPCAEGATPCRFLGYRFENRGVVYFIGADGTLRVISADGNVLLQERGVWQP